MEQSSTENNLLQLSVKSLEFLYKEYESLKDLHSQSESAIQNLFNFYLTVLSAIIAAVIIIFQINAYSISGIGTIFSLLIFAITIGIFYQSGIVIKYADQMRYAKTINELRAYIVEYVPEVKTPLYETLFKAPILEEPEARIERLEMKMWWLFPINTPQLFVAFINSVCIAALLWLPLLYTSLTLSALWQTIIVSFLVFWLAIIANDSYARIRLRREISRYSKKMSIPANE